MRSSFSRIRAVTSSAHVKKEPGRERRAMRNM